MFERRIPKVAPALRIAFALTLVGTLAAGNSPAADVFDQFYRYVESKNKRIEPHLPGERIDHFTGNLSISQEDLALPGKGGLDLRIIRTYSSKIWQRSDVASSTQPLLIDVNHMPMGFGWSLHMGRVRDPYATGPTFPVFESQVASSRAFCPCAGVSTANSPGCTSQITATSRDNWKYQIDCPNSQSVCITSTQGQRLEFDKANQYFTGANTLILPLSRISDVFGNHIDIAYQPGGTLGGSNGRIAHITDTLNRTVTFNYAPCDGASSLATCIQLIRVDGTGKTGDACSNNNQCSNQACVDLHQAQSGAWQPGNCD